MVGPVLPPHLLWVRNFVNLPPALNAQVIPKCVNCLPSSLPLVGDWMDCLQQMEVNKVSLSEPLMIELSIGSDQTPSVHASELPAIEFTATKGPVSVNQRRPTRSPLVREEEEFSTRRITRSCAKKSGFKPVSAIPPKASPMHQPRAKKPRLQVPTVASAEEDNSNQADIPPPTPIRAMQDLGVELGIAPEALTTTKLMAVPAYANNPNVSHD